MHARSAGVSNEKPLEVIRDCILSHAPTLGRRLCVLKGVLPRMDLLGGV